MIKLGITGGMASGKSHCLSFLASLSKRFPNTIYTLNLDHLGQKIYQLNPQKTLGNIARVFGPDCVNMNTLKVNR